MSNPSPRPALRKAEDAEVHPAAPHPVRTPRAARPATASTPEPPAPAERSSRGKRSKGTISVDPIASTSRPFSGSTSDFMRPPESDPLEYVVPIGAAQPTPEGTKSKKQKKSQAPKSDALMKGKSTDLDVRVPKALVKAARARAKAEGLDLDTVVIDLLHEWTVRSR